MGDDPKSDARDLRIRELEAELAHRREAEQQLAHTQKLESLGLLAGAIARDLHHRLAGVRSRVDSAVATLPAGSEGRLCVQDAQDDLARASALVSQLLTYSGEDAGALGPHSLAALVTEVGALLEVSVSRGVRLARELDPAGPVVHGDAAQLRQVLVTLVTNASEALGEHGGQVTVRTGRLQLDREALDRCVVRGPLPEGECAFLEVSDDGPGLADDARDRLFEPFFSTKRAGRGLGLTAVRSIIQRHQGAIALQSSPGRGFALRLLLPLHGPVPVTAAAPEVRVPRRRVLLVDDEAAVRTTTRKMLELEDVQVFVAENGPEAVQVFRAHAAEIDVVLLDLNMPGQDGPETFLDLRAIRPDARVMLMSGFGAREAMERFASLGLAGFLQKPFTFPALMEAVGLPVPIRRPRPARPKAP